MQLLAPTLSNARPSFRRGVLIMANDHDPSEVPDEHEASDTQEPDEDREAEEGQDRSQYGGGGDSESASDQTERRDEEKPMEQSDS